MDRRTIDEDLDDLTLDADLDADGDDESVPTGVMAPSSKRTSARKTPARKPAAGESGNGRVGSNGSAKPKSDDDALEDSVAEDVATGAKSAGKSPAEETTVVVPAVAGVANDAVDDFPTESASADRAPAEADAAGTDTAKDGTDDGPVTTLDSTPAEVVESPAATPPAMPADDIWTPRSSRSGSGMTSSWTPVEASDRPRGNAFEVNDAFSAPPMPSEPVTSRSPSASPTSLKQAAPRLPGTADPDAAAKKPDPAAKKSGFAAALKSGAVGQKARTTVPKPKAAVRRSSARQAHLTIARVEPWSVMKFSFAVSVIAFVILFVAVAVLYGVLSALGVFDSLQHLVTSVTSSQTSAGYNVRQWFSASRVLGYTALLGCLNIVLITAMSTIGAVIYNLTSRLIGGVEVTLRETD